MTKVKPPKFNWTPALLVMASRRAPLTTNCDSIDKLEAIFHDRLCATGAHLRRHPVPHQPQQEVEEFSYFPNRDCDQLSLRHPPGR